MDVDDEEDPVPEITKRHFEEAMKFARRLKYLLFIYCYLFLINVYNTILQHLFYCFVIISERNAWRADSLRNL